MSYQIRAMAELERRNRVRTAPPITIWKPNAGPQETAFNSDADEIFYGGQAGGGKTDLGLGLAIMAHRRSIIFRRTYNQLTGAEGIIQRSHDILDDVSAARFVGSPTPIWRDIPGDRALEFGAVEQEKDVSKYKGRAHDLKVFDEITEFSEFQYLFLIGWLRTRHKGQRLRVICTGNPPTSSEGFWVVQRWGAWLDPTNPHPAQPGELRWYARLDNKDTEVNSPEPFEYVSKSGKVEWVRPKSRTFIRASVYDNPKIDIEAYVAQLQSLPEPLRSQLLYGDFSARPGDAEWQIIKTEWVWKAQERWREWEAAGKPRHFMTSLGVDVGSGQAGRDATVYAPVYDVLKVDDLIRPEPENVNTATMEFAAGVKDILDNNPSAEGIIDAMGIGLGMLQRLYEQGAAVRAFIASAATTLTDRSGTRGFVNARAAVWWLAGEMLNPENGFDVCLPPDPILTADLTAPRYRIAPNGRIQVEEKESIKARIKRSTDSGDSVVTALAGKVVLDNLGKEDIRTEINYNPPRIGNY